MKKLSVLLLFFCSVTAFAQYNFKAIDSLLSQYDKPGTPGVSMRVVKNGKVIYNRYAGFENLEKNKHLSDKTIFYLASVSKQFTGSCIVLLEQQGKLRLDDKLSKYYPDFPDAQKITIKDLLNHTSGIKDILALAFLRGDNNAMDYDNKQIEKFLALQELDFEPGSQHSYSNSGYWFLAQIVEKVSGQHIKHFAKANVFKPLKMKNTAYFSVGDKVKNRALGYTEDECKYVQTHVDAKSIIGAGVDSTVDDLQLWLQEMQDKKILGEAFWKKMLDEDFYDDEGDIYTKGLGIHSIEGFRQIEHGGDNHGFHTYVSCYPDEHLSIITLSNNDGIAPDALETIAARIALGLPYSEYVKEYSQSEDEPVITMEDSVLSQYSGLYVMDKYYFLVKHAEGRLGLLQVYNGNGYELKPVNDTTFVKGKTNFVFENISDGKAQNMVFFSGVKKNTAVRKNITAKDISDCTGTFYSANLEANYVFYAENGELKCNIADKDIEDPDYGGDTVILSRGFVKYDLAEDGTVTGFTLNHTRVQNLKFVKI